MGGMLGLLRDDSYGIRSFTLQFLLFTFFLSICLAQPVKGNAQHSPGTDTLKVESGWNLLSLPLVLSDRLKTSVFPSAVSDAFIYDNQYIAVDTLTIGCGYWIKFSAAESFVVYGDAVLCDTVDVQPGWNLIGSITVPVVVNTILTTPPGNVISDFFYYSSVEGYQPSDTIKPGKGYWVKVSQPGWIILAGGGGKACPGVPFVEYGGRKYNTVQIGNQCWLKENLDAGTRLDDSLSQADNGIIEKYCYSNDTTYCDIYGGLYQWDEVMQYDTTEGARGICPPGWHVPKLSEFDTLLSYVNNDGNSLKAVGQGDFDGIGTDTSGFSGLLTGYHHVNGGFFQLTDCTFFWTTTLNIYSDVYCIALYKSWGTPGRAGNPGGMGYSVRCLKDL